MDSISKKFRVNEEKKVSLKDFDTKFTGDYKKEDAVALLESLKEEMADLHDKLYADNRYSLLIVFQAMDAAGKDSAIKHVMSGLNPQGCQVYSFKQPSEEEYDHDFLWRHYKALPEKGRIGIHNRSHYENVLVCKVHPEVVMKERIVGYETPEKLDKDFWDDRYKSIRNFEKHLTKNNTVIVKFFLHLSKEEQKERFMERIENPEKNWKFSAFDLDEREKWDTYQKAYEDAICNTATENSPWYIIPADKKWFTRIAISQIILETMKSLDMSKPALTAEDQAILATSRKRLQDEK